MKKISVLALSCFIASCATGPKKEYDWINSQGNIASPEELQAVKSACKYDEGIEKATLEMKTAMMVGRYENTYGPKKSDENVNRAAELIANVNQCMKEKGFSTKEKAISNKKK